MDQYHGDEMLEHLTASPKSVIEIMKSPTAWDVDGHDALWWAKRLAEKDFFDNLTNGDRAVMISAILKSTDTWTNRLKQEILMSVTEELSE